MDDGDFRGVMRREKVRDFDEKSEKYVCVHLCLWA